MSLKYRDSAGVETPVAGLNATTEDLSQIAQNTANFAPAFSESTSYAVGDYCTYDGKLYRCIIAHIAGTFVAGHFTQVTACSELEIRDITSECTTSSYVDDLRVIVTANILDILVHVKKGTQDQTNLVVIPLKYRPKVGLAVLPVFYVNIVDALKGCIGVYTNDVIQLRCLNTSSIEGDGGVYLQGTWLI